MKTTDKLLNAAVFAGTFFMLTTASAADKVVVVPLGGTVGNATETVGCASRTIYV